MMIMNLVSNVRQTCFKSLSTTCIGNFATNKRACFMKTLIFETTASNHHKPIDKML